MQGVDLRQIDLRLADLRQVRFLFSADRVPD